MRRTTRGTRMRRDFAEFSQSDAWRVGFILACFKQRCQLSHCCSLASLPPITGALISDSL